MNATSLRMALTSNNFRARIFNAIRAVTQLKRSISSVLNRKGSICLYIVYTKEEGLIFRNSKGQRLNKRCVFSMLQGV